jgi:hypothetical protein
MGVAFGAAAAAASGRRAGPDPLVDWASELASQRVNRFIFERLRGPSAAAAAAPCSRRQTPQSVISVACA